MLDVGCQVQQVALVATFRMYGRYGKLAVGQRAGLVEDDGVDFRQQVDVVGTLDEDALARGSAYGAKEGEGDADDEGAGAADDEEHQGAVEPSGER